MRVDDLLKSYEQIDEMVERVRRSELYSEVLRILFKKGKLSIDEIARNLNMDKRKIYDTCYNLTRSNWSPNPVKNTPSGEWELTLPGEILVNRLLEKYGISEFKEPQTARGNNVGKE
jgi:Mn-dependent DtxR family transcriptional regulator